MTKKTKDISKNVINQIKNQHIEIKPKSYFVLGSVLFSIGISTVFLISIFFLNLFIFRYRLTSYQFPLYPSCFQPQLLFSNLPFYAIAISAIFLIFGIRFLKKSDMAYKFNPLLVAFTTALLVVLAGFLLDKTGFNHHLGPHFLPPLYEIKHRPPLY